MNEQVLKAVRRQIDRQYEAIAERLNEKSTDGTLPVRFHCPKCGSQKYETRALGDGTLLRHCQECVFEWLKVNDEQYFFLSVSDAQVYIRQQCADELERNSQEGTSPTTCNFFSEAAAFLREHKHGER